MLRFMITVTRPARHRDQSALPPENSRIRRSKVGAKSTNPPGSNPSWKKAGGHVTCNDGADRRQWNIYS